MILGVTCLLTRASGTVQSEYIWAISYYLLKIILPFRNKY
nr:MAG TPA: hypothetical protein [Caudoviricetes sp.]